MKDNKAVLFWMILGFIFCLGAAAVGLWGEWTHIALNSKQVFLLYWKPLTVLILGMFACFAIGGRMEK